MKENKVLISKKIKELFSYYQFNKPVCSIYCFSGSKKFNSYTLNRILPSDTLYRIWFYDVNPLPDILENAKYLNYKKNTCLIYQVTMRLSNNNINSTDLTLSPSNSLCSSNELPYNLNNKDYLGDINYVKNYGFHILDSFRVDRIKNNIHFTKFNISNSYLFRFLMIPGRVKVDITLYKITNEKKNIVAKSHSSNNELILLAEIPRGSYIIQFKFYPTSFGFTKCESVKIEFAMMAFDKIQSNIKYMLDKYNNKFDKDGYPLKTKKFNFMSHLIKTIGDFYNKPLEDITYIIKTELPINIEEKKNLEPVNQLLTFKNLTFIIEEKDNKKLKIIGYIQSDFLFIDASIYLIYYKTEKVKLFIVQLIKKISIQ